MEIKRVDDKRMVIHTKAKAKIRIKSSSGSRKKKEENGMAQKKSVESGGKKTETGYKGLPYSITDNKKQAAVQRIPGNNGQAAAGKKAKEKTAALQDIQEKTGSSEETMYSTSKENEMYIRYQKIRAKKEKTSIKKHAVLKMAGAAVSQEALKQTEGGEEIWDSCIVAAAVSVPAVNAAKAGKRLFQMQAEKARRQKIKQLQTGSQVKKREAADNAVKPDVMQNSHSTGNGTAQQTDGRWNTQNTEKKAGNPTAEKPEKITKYIINKTVPAAGMAEIHKKTCHIKTVKKQKEKQVRPGSQIKQKEIKDIIKIADRASLETGYAAGKTGIQKEDAKTVYQKTEKLHNPAELIKETKNNRLADRYGKKTGNIKVKLPTDKMAKKETGSKPEKTAGSVKLKPCHKQGQPPANASIQKTVDKAAMPEKVAGKPDAGNHLQQLAVKKISAKEKIKQRNKIKEVKTAVSVNDRHGRKANSTGNRKTEKKVKPEDTKRRMVQVFTDRLRQEENQEKAGKTLKDAVKVHFSVMVKQMACYVGLFFLAATALSVIVLLPVILVIAVLYNSPLAIFFPSISSGDTTQDVLSAYMEEFNHEVDREVSSCTGYNSSQKVYVNLREGQAVTDNYYDILAVYMVKYGTGDTATDMTDHAKQNLEDVFNDMCSYYVTSSAIPVVCGDRTVIVYTAKYVKVVLKSWQDMVSVYNFNEEEQELLAEIMKPENLALLGYSGNGGGEESPGILPEQYQAVSDGVSDENGRKVLEFALSKVGCPYSQELRDNGTYFDCSSLAYYAWQNAGVNIMYNGANTATAEGQYCFDNSLLVHYEEMQPGDLIFYSYQSNGRFMDISHVAIYAGNGMVVEAANTELGVVYRPVQGRDSIVLIGRPG